MSELIDNSRHRIQALKTIIRQLHDGASPDSLKTRFKSVLDEVGPSEIGAMENELLAEGMPQAEIQRMCDVHAAVLADGLAAGPEPELPPGHPVHTFRLENERIRELTASNREVVATLVDTGEDRPTPEALAEWRRIHAELSKIDGHYRRKENLVFPFLEQAGIAGPPKVMWGVHDEIRDRLKAAGEVLDAASELDGDGLALAYETVILPMLEQVDSMTTKEDRILWPMCLAHLTATEWNQVHEQWDELGEGLVRPAGAWLPVLPQVPQKRVELPADDAIRLPSGHLTLRQLTALLDTLPADLTFVDADGRVAYFSEGSDRVFDRNRTIIGRRVEDCHPPKSVHLVQQVVDELRSGQRDVAEFWIQMGERFVHIRYFAVRDTAGEYLGTLEITQDIAPLRALEGERRLLAEAAHSEAS